MNGVHPNLRRIQFFFLALAIVSPIFFIAALVFGSSQELIVGIAIEVLGAWLTAGGVLGFETLFAVPDEDVIALQQKIEAQEKKLDELIVIIKRLNNKQNYDNYDFSSSPNCDCSITALSDKYSPNYDDSKLI